MIKSLLMKASAALLLLLLMSASAQAQQGEPIGLMLSTIGTVSAEDEDGNVRRLQRRSPVFEGDTVTTADRARAQIRFNDRGLVALQPNTSFYIEEHEFNGQEDGTESAIYSLLRGGLQAITGLIGHTNRDSYRVSTPLATIGLRGTHWAATFCTTACDGNPPGLYGGVADGGIDVCNGGGCTAVGANTYFYTPDANTRPQTLLAPPSVVFADSTEVEDDEEEVASTDTTDSSSDDAGDEDTVSDVAAFVERTENENSVTANALTSTESNENRIELDEDDALSQRNEDEVSDVVTRDTPTVAAGQGSVVALASAQSNPANAAQVQALNILLEPSGTTSLPRAALVEPVVVAADPVEGTDAVSTVALGALDFSLTDIGCDPCLYATAGVQNTVAELVEFKEFRVDGVDVYLGRWQGQALLRSSNSTLNALNDHHYAIALDANRSALNDQLQVVQPTAFGYDAPANAFLARFDLLGATAPTDAAGVTGTLQSARLDLDFAQQLITYMDVNLLFDDQRSVFASLSQQVQLPQNAFAGLFVPLSGGCEGGSCGSFTSLQGSTSLSFVGASANHVMGVYALDDRSSFAQSFYGTYLLEQTDFIDPYQVDMSQITPGLAADGAAASVASILDSNGSFLPVNTVTGAGAGNSIELLNVYDSPNSVVGLNFDQGTFGLGSGRLAEFGQFAANGNTIYFGRWDSSDSNLELSGSVQTITGPSVYVFSPSAYLLPTFEKPTVVSYSLADGPAPVDQNGNTGTLNSLDITLDFYYQTIDQFDIDATAGGATLTAGLSGPAALVPGISTFFLRGQCVNGDCGSSLSLSGNGSLLVGDDTASSLYGTYGLYAQGAQLAATALQVGAGGINALVGSYVASGAQVTFHPDYVEGPALSPTTGIAAAAAIEQFTGGTRPIGTTMSSDEGTLATLTVDDAMNAVVSLRSTETDCLGCGFDLLSGVLIDDAKIADIGGVSGLDAYLGTWGDASFDLSQDVGTGTLLPTAHYVFSDSPTDLELVPEFPVSAPLLQYSLAGATSATDSAGNTGFLNSANLELDLIQQLVTGFDLDISIGSRNLSASQYQNTLIDEALLDGLKLLGSCSGTDCGSSTVIGESSLGLIGAAAEGAIGHYGLFEYSGAIPPNSSLEELVSDYSVGGVFALERGAAIQNPLWYEGEQLTTAAAAGLPFAFAGHLGPETELFPFTRGFEVDVDNNFYTLNGTNKVWSYDINQVDLGLLEQTGFCYYCDEDFDPIEPIFDEFDAYTELVSIDETLGALLVEYADVSATGYSAHYGRWLAPDGFLVDVTGTSIPTGTDAHYIWATSMPTADFYLPVPALVRYSLEGGTRPTNEFGQAGTLRSVNLDLDLFQQAVTGFDMALDIGERSYMAGLLPWDTTLLLDGEVGGSIDVRGKCEFGDCGEGVPLAGRVTLGFVGDPLETDQLLAFEGVIGSYALETLNPEDNPFNRFQHSEYLGELTGDLIDQSEMAPFVSAAGTFHLTQETGTDHPNYIDLNAAGAPVPMEVGGLAAFALTRIEDCEGDCYTGWQHILDTSEGDQIAVIDVNDAGNQVASFIDQSSVTSTLLLQRIFDLEDGVLAEQGGFADFLAETGVGGSDQFGINWGRWVSMPSVTETDLDISDPQNPFPTGSPYVTGALPMQHFVYTDAPVGDFPLFTEPTQLLYTYVGGPAPATLAGSTGRMNAQLAIDLYSQVLTDFSLVARVEDEAYRAWMYQDNPQGLGMPLAQLMDQDFIRLEGTCAGGDCTWYDSGELVYGGGYVNTDLIGFASLAPFGNNLEGFLGAFELSPGDASQFDDYYTPLANTFEGPTAFDYEVQDHGYLQGGFVLANTDSRTNPFWTVNPSSVAAAAPSIGVITGTTFNTNSLPYEPFAHLINPAESGAELRLDQIEGLDNIIAAATNPDVECFVCSFDVADAVLVDHGFVGQSFNYLEGAPAEVFWGLWSHRDEPGNEWLFDGSDTAIDSARLTGFVFADQLTPQSAFASLEPLTPSYYGGGYASYDYFGGPAPVNEYGELGWVEFGYADVNFLSQTLDYFAMDMNFADGREMNVYSDGYGTPLSNQVELSLIGNCYGCGVAAGDIENLVGTAQLAFVGGQAEQIIGGLQAYSDGTYPGTLAPPGSYSVQAGFVLNQYFNSHWVVNPQGEPVPDGSAVTFVGANSTGDVLQTAFYTGDNGSTAEIHNVVDTSHEHQNSLIAFNAVGDSLCGDCSWEIVEGELQDYWSTTEYSTGATYLPDIYWGRWMPSEANVDDNGTAVLLEDWQHFAWSPDATQYSDPVFADAVMGDTASYSMLDSTYASGFDSTGTVTSGGLTGANMVVDFFDQQIDAYNIYFNSFTGTSNNHFLGLSGPVDLEVGSPVANLSLIGDIQLYDSGTGATQSYQGTETGTATVQLVGPEAEAAISSYNVNSGFTGQSWNGTIIFENNAVNPL